MVLLCRGKSPAGEGLLLAPGTAHTSYRLHAAQEQRSKPARTSHTLPKGKNNQEGKRKRQKPQGKRVSSRAVQQLGRSSPTGMKRSPWPPRLGGSPGCPHPLRYSQSQGWGGSDHSRHKNKTKNGYRIQAIPKTPPHLPPWHQLCAGHLSLSKRLFLLLCLGLGLKKPQGLELQGHFACQKGQSFGPLEF